MPLKVTNGGRTIVNNFLGFSKSKKSKKSKKSTRHARRLAPKLTRKQIQSTMGKIQPPLDVNDNNLNKLFDVIKAGPITIVLVHANWCGHCHHLMPHWDKASHLKNRSVQTVKVEESMLPKVNAALSRMNNKENTINVEGYPSGFLVSNKGDIIEKIALSPETLSTVMTKTGPIADEMIRREEGEGEGEGEEGEGEEGEGEEDEGEEGEEEGEEREKSNNLKTVKPSNPYDDIEGFAIRQPVGGSLYSLMAKTTYTLAPTIALLATAKAIMKPRGTRKRSMHKRRTHKRRA